MTVIGWDVITAQMKKALLECARSAIEVHWCAGEASDGATGIEGLTQMRAGVFVSLHVEGKLRGCIGNLEGSKPLPELVAEMASSAAFEDPRFEPLQASELPGVQIEISVLSTPVPILSMDEIRIGEHGLLVRMGRHQAVLLPQVATRKNWDAKLFLSHVCQKARLSGEAWRNPDLQMFCFSAEVFSDPQIESSCPS